MMGYLMHYKLILFDLDDTLFEFKKKADTSLESTFRALNLPFDQETSQIYFEISRKLWKRLENGEISAEELFQLRAQDLFDFIGKPHLAKDFNAIYLDLLSGMPELIPGALEAVRRLNPHAEIGIVTNGAQRIQTKRLAHSPLAPYISFLVTSDHVGYAKPAPQIFHHALKLSRGATAETTLMVGDNLMTDIAGGHAAGLTTCWYNHWRSPPSSLPHHTIDHLADLLDVLALC